MNTTQPSTAIALHDLRTVEGLAAEKPELLTVPMLRYYLRDRDTNGLAPATVRVGKRLLISLPRFEQWLTERAGS